MLPIVILSPHRDDAVFSLAHALRHWDMNDIALRVVNIYTTSNYAPRAVSKGSLGVLSALRKREDQKALHFVARSAISRDLHQLDAPLAFNVQVLAVSGPNAMEVRAQDIVSLTQFLRPLVKNCRVVAPLGLGNHVNHLIVKRAAMACVRAHRLAFYEDLPYATWAIPDEWHQRLRESSGNGKQPLRALTLRSGKSVWWKSQATRLYQSQADQLYARQVAGFSRLYGAGERLWIPRHSPYWNTR